MAKFHSLVVVLLIAVINNCYSQEGGTYLVMSPAVIRPSMPLQFTTTILRASSQVSVSAVLLHNDTAISGTSVTAQGQQGDVIRMQIQVPGDIDTTNAYKLQVTGSGGLDFSNETSLKVDSKSVSVFIQTDKAIYKPSQKVMFRAFAVYPNLRPYMGPLDVAIRDANDNKIKQWLSVSDPSGVYSNELQLSDQPVLGDWKFTVKAKDWSQDKTFTVDEYVLPKFEVNVELPSYYSAVLKGPMDVRVTAKYTYGEPVKGNTTIHIGVQRPEWEDRVYPVLVKTIDLNNEGKAKIVVREQELLNLVPAPTWHKDPERFTPNMDDLKARTIQVNASVTEKVTGVSLKGESSVEVPYQDYQVEFLEQTPSSFKPNLNFTVFLKVTQADGQPPRANQLVDAEGQPELLELSYNLRYSGYNEAGEYITRRRTDTHSLTVPETGILQFSKEIGDYTSLDINGHFKQFYVYHSAQKFKSRDDKGLQVSLGDVEMPLKPKTFVEFTVKATEAITTFYYEIFAKGKSVVSSSVTESPALETTSFAVSLTPALAAEMAPSARIVVWYPTSVSGEIISDALDFTVAGAFANNVSVAYSRDRVMPAESVDVSVSAAPMSYVGLLAVDQSVLLLKTGNDIERDDVLSELKTYDSKNNRGSGGGGDIMPLRGKRSAIWWWPWFSGGTDSSDVFKEAGLVIMTDAFVYDEPQQNNYHYMEDDMVMMEAAGAPGMDMADGGGRMMNKGVAAAAPSSPGAAPMKESRVRTAFPETWLWSSETVGSDGTASITTTAPDTITSWILSAFALNDNAGLGLSNTRPQLTVFKQFFVSLTLPKSVVRGEEFELTASVFNYLESAQDVQVTLKASTEFESRLYGQAEATSRANNTLQGTVSVAAKDAQSVTFMVKPVDLDFISIEVSARTPTAADAVRRTLWVKPEGRPIERAPSVLLQLEANDPPFQTTIPTNLPPVGRVPGSERIVVTAIGDIMGTSMTNLDSLLKMPYGCGEQNMINFAPNIYVMKYLTVTNQVTAEIREKANRFMESGYQRELTYQRNDGSFSAFGKGDPSGSMWLTAFVAKSFEQAKPYIYIDPEVIEKAITWIVNKQQRDGSFKEPPEGRVIHTDMQGGSSSGSSLTAYVLITLLETKKNSRRSLDQYIDKARHNLENAASEVENDPYALAIMTYALSMAQSYAAQVAMNKLNDLAVTGDGLKYWTKGSETKGGHQPRSGTVNIEMTAYGLLATVTMGSISDAVPIMKWMVQQRNAFGGYYNTQDTVVGLNALSEVGGAMSGTDGSGLTITATSGSATHTFETIAANNKLLLQSWVVPGTPSDIRIQGSGAGFGIVQVSVMYNVYDAENKTDVGVTVTTFNETGNVLVIDTCAQWNKPDVDTGMFIIEVNQLSGHVPLTDNLDSYKDTVGLMRYENQQDKLTLYFNEMTDVKRCVQVRTTKVSNVMNLKKASVVAYQYYNPDVQAVDYYHPSTAKTGPWRSDAVINPRFSLGLLVTLVLASLLSCLLLR